MSRYLRPSSRTPSLRRPLLAVMALMVGGCSGGDRGGGAGGFSRPPTPVETAIVAASGVADRFEAVGTIEAAEAVTVVSEINGIVVALPFREGSDIQKGELIAQLDDSELQAEVARTEALLAQRRSAYERTKLVVEKRAGAPQDLDDAAAELKVAEANVAFARARLAKTRIVAPFDGTVGARRVSPGAFLRVGDPITDLAQVRHIEVVFTAPERFVPRLKRGLVVTISNPAFPGESLSGIIEVIDPVLDSATRSVQVIAHADNPEKRFRPGMSANVTAVLAERPSALVVPSEAVFAEGNQTLVYVVKADSTVTRTPVVLGTRLADAVEVVEGLEAGARVVRAGHQKLFEGARVMPVTSRPPRSGSAAAAGAEERQPSAGETR